MDRPALERRVTERPKGSGLSFEIASPRHDAAIRRLLRESTMRGMISLTFEREPSFFGGAVRKGDRESTIVALDGERVISMGRCLERLCFLDGNPKRVGYLSELRLDASFQGRFDLLRKGYAFTREHLLKDPADIYFTSIAVDNVRARRLLERGAPGLPTYIHLANLETHLIPVGRRQTARSNHSLEIERATSDQAAELASFLNKQSSPFDLSTVWSEDLLLEETGTGRVIDSFHISTRRSEMVACAALWDQRSFRQTVVRGYASPVKFVRPILNLIALATGTPPLPTVGSILAHAFLSPFAVSQDAEGIGLALVEAMMPLAREAGLSFLTLSLDSNDPAGISLRRRFHPRVYHSRLYRVDWAGFPAATERRTPGLVLPDAAFL
jgi:hypothetical protein